MIIKKQCSLAVFGVMSFILIGNVCAKNWSGQCLFPHLVKPLQTDFFVDTLDIEYDMCANLDEQCLFSHIAKPLQSDFFVDTLSTRYDVQDSMIVPCKKKSKRLLVNKTVQFIGELFKDALELHKNLFTWNSFKVVMTTFPFFVGTRMIDERLQNCFYDQKRHKNKRFMSRWCHDVAQTSIAVPMLGLGTQMFFGKTEEMRETTRVFLLGIPFLIWAKDLIKKLRFDANLRPWHEDFSCEERSGGGFPSGHMAEAVYTAALYGMRFGPRFAIPLGALASFIGVTFVTCNRHYFSQIIAGAGLGVLYAVAANTLINTKLTHECHIGITVTNDGAPAVGLSYNF